METMKILIPAYTGLGNFILKTPMIKTIKKLYPHSQIDVLAGNNFGTEFVLKDSSLIGKTILFKEGNNFIKKIKFALWLKKNKYDILFLPFDSSLRFLNIFSGFIANQSVCHYIIPKTLKQKIKFVISLCYPHRILVPVMQGKHEIDLNFDLLEALYNKPFTRDYEPFINCSKSEKVLHRFKLKAKQYIVMQVGAANGSQTGKKWDIENFENLIKKINSTIGITVVTVGDQGDYKNDIIKLENKGLFFTNTAGLTSIDEVANILYFSKLVVAHDSGIMHIANALQCNLIALYGPTDYTRTKPLGKNTQILYSKNEYFASMYNQKAHEYLLPYPDCMAKIKVDDVFDVIRKEIKE